MKTTRFILTSMFIAMLGYTLQGKAEDIDLYSSVSSVTGTDLPNVLFVLDNAANFDASTSLTCTYADTGGAPNMAGKTAGLEQCALNNAINALPTKAGGTSAVVNVGIMVYNDSKFATQWGCNTSAAGGCLVQKLIPMTSTNKASLMATIKSWTAATIKGNNEATAQGMQEAWAYYAGATGMSGTTYISPATAGCQKNFVIFIGNATTNAGSPGDASSTPGTGASPTPSLNTTITTRIDPTTTLVALTSAQQTLLKANIQITSGAYGAPSFSCGSYTMPSHTDNSGLYADEWARYMNVTDLKTGAMPANRNITTYTVGVLDTSCKPDYPALLTSMAIQGKGKYFATNNAADITQALLRILNEVQAVNSVFSSASLPVSVNTQGTFLNQIFMGMFRPDAGGVPRWLGNLKQYQFGYDATLKQLFMADATATSAISSAGTGFLSPNAASFWTCSNTANTQNKVAPYNVAPYSTTSICSTDPAVGFWANQPNGQGLAWDLPDGEVVEKGGAAQMMRLSNLVNTYTTAPGSSTNPRKLYTYCPSGTGCVAACRTPPMSLIDQTRPSPIQCWVQGQDQSPQSPALLRCWLAAQCLAPAG